MKEIEIPEGYEARIEGNKVIIEPKESEDERIRKRLIDCLKFSLKGAEEQDAAGCSRQKDIEAYKWGIAYLEKQKEQRLGVDLAEEITRFFSKNAITYEHLTDWPLLKNTALHFAEWGAIHLNARKEHPALPGVETAGIPGKDFIPAEWVDACERYGKWKIVKQEQPESPSNLDEAAKEYNRNYTPFEQCDSRDIIRVFKAGAEWLAGQFQKIEGELVDWYETNGVDYCHGINTKESFEVPEGFYIKKK